MLEGKEIIDEYGFVSIKEEPKVQLEIWEYNNDGSFAGIAIAALKDDKTFGSKEEALADFHNRTNPAFDPIDCLMNPEIVYKVNGRYDEIHENILAAAK